MFYKGHLKRGSQYGAFLQKNKGHLKQLLQGLGVPYEPHWVYLNERASSPMGNLPFLGSVLGGAERYLAADAAGGAGDDDHAAGQQGRAAHDRSRRS